MASPVPVSNFDTGAGIPLRIVVTGGTGLIGSALVAALREHGHQVQRLTHGPIRDATDLHWDPRHGVLDPEPLEGVDAVVNLAGAPVAERWTSDRKREIRDSRVLGTTLLAHALASLSQPPRVFASGSAIGIYGNRGNDSLDEDSAAGSDFLATVSTEWEAATAPASEAGVRVVLLRTGIVLTPLGGVLQKMLPPFRLGLGGRLGSGAQWISWIALDDEVRAIEFVLALEMLRGPVNLVAPNPVTNAEFAKTLGRVLARPAVAAVPGALFTLAFGQMAQDTALASQLVRPRTLLEAGFSFRHPTLEQALRSSLDR